MVLVAALHHSRDVGPVSYPALRSQRTARAGEATYYTSKTSVARDTAFFSLFDVEDAVWGTRPTPLSEVWPQDGMMRHAVRDHEHYAPMVQVLDAPVPQPTEIPQRTMDDMLQDMLDRVQQQIAPLAEMEVVPRPVPPDKTQQREVEQVGVPVLSLVDGDAVFDRAQQRIVEQFLFEQRTVDPMGIPVPGVVEEPAEVYSVPQERVQQQNVVLGMPLGLDQLVPQERVQQRPVSQVVDVLVPPVPVSASL